MNKLEFSKLNKKEDMILAFNQLKDDYRQLFAINDDLQSKIDKANEILDKLDMQPAYLDCKYYELGGFDELRNALKEEQPKETIELFEGTMDQLNDLNILKEDK